MGGMWNVEDNTTVIVWQSPGIELPASPGDSEAKADPSTLPDADCGRVKEFRILEPSTIEAGSTDEQAIAVLKEQLLKSSTDDNRILAEDSRKALTEKMGPIWHVVVGKDFVVEAAADRRSFVLLAMGKTRIVCFQHEHITGGTTINWDKLFKTLPYLALAFFCLAYISLQALCRDSISPEGVWLARIHNKGCYDGWTSDWNMAGAVVVGGLFLFKKARIYTSR